MVSKNFTDPAISSLKTDRDAQVGVSNGGDGRGALHVKLTNPSGSGGPFDPPVDTTSFTSSFDGVTQVIKYFNGLDVLKTITISYDGCNFSGVIS